MIHQKMTEEITIAGGRIDGIYFCTDVEKDSQNRKPNAGMGLQAKKDFPAIDLNKAIMVGNNLSDMEFGRNIGAKTIFLSTTNPVITLADERIDAVCHSLLDLAQSL